MSTNTSVSIAIIGTCLYKSFVITSYTGVFCFGSKSLLPRNEENASLD